MVQLPVPAAPDPAAPVPAAPPVPAAAVPAAPAVPVRCLPRPKCRPRPKCPPGALSRLAPSEPPSVVVEVGPPDWATKPWLKCVMEAVIAPATTVPPSSSKPAPVSRDQ